MGYNVNVAWTGGVDPPIGDVEYLTAFRWGLRRAKGGVGPELAGAVGTQSGQWRGMASMENRAWRGFTWPLLASAWAIPLQDSGDAHCPRVLTGRRASLRWV